MLQRDYQRLEHIRDYCDNVKQAIARFGNSYEIFRADTDYQYIISFCILQIGELANALTAGYRRQTQRQMNWPAIRGMRNIVVHDYGSVDIAVLWDTAIHSCPSLRVCCSEQLQQAGDYDKLPQSENEA